jgi:hypothetical protein
MTKAVPYLGRLATGFIQRWPGFEPVSSHVGFVVDNVALGQVSSEYLAFPCQSFIRPTAPQYVTSATVDSIEHHPNTNKTNSMALSPRANYAD